MASIVYDKVKQKRKSLEDEWKGWDDARRSDKSMIIAPVIGADGRPAYAWVKYSDYVGGDNPMYNRVRDWYSTNEPNGLKDGALRVFATPREYEKDFAQYLGEEYTGDFDTDSPVKSAVRNVVAKALPYSGEALLLDPVRRDRKTAGTMVKDAVQDAISLAGYATKLPGKALKTVVGSLPRGWTGRAVEGIANGLAGVSLGDAVNYFIDEARQPAKRVLTGEAGNDLRQVFPETHGGAGLSGERRKGLGETAIDAGVAGLLGGAFGVAAPENAGVVRRDIIADYLSKDKSFPEFMERRVSQERLPTGSATDIVLMRDRPLSESNTVKNLEQVVTDELANGKGGADAYAKRAFDSLGEGWNVYTKPVDLGGVPLEKLNAVLADIQGSFGDIRKGVIPGEIMTRMETEARSAAMKDILEKFGAKSEEELVAKLPNGKGALEAMLMSELPKYRTDELKKAVTDKVTKEWYKKILPNIQQRIAPTKELYPNHVLDGMDGAGRNQSAQMRELNPALFAGSGAKEFLAPSSDEASQTFSQQLVDALKANRGEFRNPPDMLYDLFDRTMKGSKPTLPKAYVDNVAKRTAKMISNPKFKGTVVMPNTVMKENDPFSAKTVMVDLSNKRDGVNRMVIDNVDRAVDATGRDITKEYGDAWREYDARLTEAPAFKAMNNANFRSTLPRSKVPYSKGTLTEALLRARRGIYDSNAAIPLKKGAAILIGKSLSPSTVGDNIKQGQAAVRTMLGVGDES